VFARLLLVGLAAAAIAVGATSLRTDHRCAEAVKAVNEVPKGELMAAARTVADRCGDTLTEVRASQTLFLRGGAPPALVIARDLTREHPDDYLGWISTWRLNGDRAALARARELNPRGTPPG
jgi:hypothetical protein